VVGYEALQGGSDFEDFLRLFHDALTHLYDPGYRPPELLCSVLGVQLQPEPEQLQTRILSAIRELEPEQHVPETARSRRIYGLLWGIYVQDLTQEETAEKLGITPRHLRRELPEAEHVLALRLWGRSSHEATRPSSGRSTEESESLDAGPSSPEHSQVQRELAALEDRTPRLAADVRHTVERATATARVLAEERGIAVVAQRVPPGLVAGIHPSVLQQVLIIVIGWMVRQLASGRIALSANYEPDGVSVVLEGEPVAKQPDNGTVLAEEMLRTQGGSIEVAVIGERLTVHMHLPSRRYAVFVVDDNPDMLYLYRRYTMGTHYRIVHAEEGQPALEAIHLLEPDIVVLDVMLPDVDGWELLSHLRQHHMTRAIPVIVCSVIQEAELALALGATSFLAKPIQRSQFIHALDEALDPS